MPTYIPEPLLLRSWHTDITYLPLAGAEFLYLATVLKCFSRKVVGWSMADHMCTSLIADALQMTSLTRGGLDGAVIHCSPRSWSPSWSSAQVGVPRGVRVTHFLDRMLRRLRPQATGLQFGVGVLA
ncbi:DDE-type integrase/transposase/recombinase [Streptomyces sp. NPDC002573]|uniref:DDE-type integrase/transposase/recombinase n=1 Tax=Streptomyces sp. NPDC002573 TaxID=3364651 RepID=UPI0036A69A01